LTRTQDGPGQYTKHDRHRQAGIDVSALEVHACAGGGPSMIRTQVSDCEDAWKSGGVRCICPDSADIVRYTDPRS
jgi:hypothetical protein